MIIERELVIAFGIDSRYVKDKGIEKFIEYIYMNGKLPCNEVSMVKEYIIKTQANIVIYTLFSFTIVIIICTSYYS